MQRYRLTPDAISDLDEIDAFIAADNAVAADRVLDAILITCQSLAAHQLIGSPRPELSRSEVRFMPVSRFPNYIVVYRPRTKPLEIVRILHGRRDLKTLLR